MIECRPTRQGPNNPPRFPPITYEAYVTWWYDANYDASLQPRAPNPGFNP